MGTTKMMMIRSRPENRFLEEPTLIKNEMIKFKSNVDDKMHNLYMSKKTLIWSKIHDENSNRFQGNLDPSHHPFANELYDNLCSKIAHLKKDRRSITSSFNCQQKIIKI